MLVVYDFKGNNKWDDGGYERRLGGRFCGGIFGNSKLVWDGVFGVILNGMGVVDEIMDVYVVFDYCWR